MSIFDLFQDTVLAVVVLVAWVVAAWIVGSILAGWVAIQAGREPLAWMVLALFLSPALALIALAGLPPLPAGEDARSVAPVQDRRLRAVSSL